MIYATTTELAAYLFVDEFELSPDCPRLLARASELVDYLTTDNFDTTCSEHLKAAKAAVCAQVEYWLSSGEETETSGQIKSFTAGKVSVTYADNSGKPVVAPRVSRALFPAGLLYRGT